MAVLQRSTWLNSLITILFVVSTIYTLAFYYYEGMGKALAASGLEEKESTALPSNPGSGWLSGLITGTLDYLLEVSSWISPFILLKLIVMAIAPEPLYKLLNMLILRPIMWIGTFILLEWSLNKLRGTSE